MTTDGKGHQIRDNRKTSYRCSFCGKNQDQVQRLIAGPAGVYICNECIDLCQEIIEDERAVLPPHPDQHPSSPPETSTSHAPTQKIYRCSFCGKHQDQVQRLIAGPEGVYICDECVALCQEIIQEERGKGKR